jgi:hypothetical protein
MDVARLYFALTGPGLLLAANAEHYARRCFAFDTRLLLMLLGMAATSVLQLAAAPSRPRGLLVYCVFCVHQLLAVFEPHHRVPAALLAVGCLLGAPRRDAVRAAALAAVVAMILFFSNFAMPLHGHERAGECSTVPAAAGLLLAGALHAFAPVMLAGEDYVSLTVALFVHAVPLVALSGTVAVLVRDSYDDMLVGGVSGREAATLAVQAGALLTVTAAAGSWAAAALSPAHHTASVLVCVAGAFFLLNFAFTEVVWWLLGLYVAMLALSYAEQLAALSWPHACAST